MTSPDGLHMPGSEDNFGQNYSWHGPRIAPRVTVMDELEQELKKLIVESLRLEDIQAQDIDSQATLFGGALGLTSIDALELAMVLSKKYGVVLDPDNEQNKAAFQSVRALAEFVSAERKPALG